MWSTEVQSAWMVRDAGSIRVIGCTCRQQAAGNISSQISCLSMQLSRPVKATIPCSRWCVHSNKQLGRKDWNFRVLQKCLYFLQLFTAMLLDCHHPGYTAALTPVSAPLLWASARQGAAGGGIADLEALSICHYMSCSIRRRCTRTSITASDCNLGEFQRDWSNLEPNRSPPLSLSFSLFC